MLRIGVTGNIGAGKSQVCRIFSLLGIPVYNADHRAKILMVKDQQLVRELKALFGPDAYLSEGLLNRKFISKLVFKEPSLLSSLNALVHPAVGRDFNIWAQEQTSSPYLIKEAALLFESGSYRELDHTILVTAEESVRIKRVIARDGFTEDEVKNRMANQMAQEEKIKLADYIIENDPGQFLVREVLNLHRIFMTSAN